MPVRAATAPLSYNFTGMNTLPAGFAVDLVNSTASTLLINQGATLVLTVTLNNATGAFEVMQNSPINHVAGNDENNYQFLIGVEVEDADGDTDPATINIIVDDDTPVATVGTRGGRYVVLDESRPVGTDTDGDSSPAGLATVQANFADNFVAPIAFGADGPGSVSYSLVLSGSNVNSGLYALAPTDTTAGDGDGIGQGAPILLNQVGNVVTGSAGGVDYFTITIDPATGVVTFTQLANVWHADTSSDDDTSTLTAALGSLQVQQSVSDADNDVATASIDLSTGVFQIEDDGPEVIAVDNLLQIDNDLTSSFGAFPDIGTDGPNARQSQHYRFELHGDGQRHCDRSGRRRFAPICGRKCRESHVQLDLDTGSGGVATAEGTLIFYKTVPNAGQYEVALTNGPVRGFGVLSTAQGTLFQGYELGTSTPDGSQAAISVTQIQGTPGDPQPDRSVHSVHERGRTRGGPRREQFANDRLGSGSGRAQPFAELPAPGAWQAGELFNQAAGWVSTSNDSNGVDGGYDPGRRGDRLRPGPGCEPDWYSGAARKSSRQASTMFLRLDGMAAR